MTGVAILCSGQGAQNAAMFDLLADAPEAAPVFAAAQTTLAGRDARDVVREASRLPSGGCFVPSTQERPAIALVP